MGDVCDLVEGLSHEKHLNRERSLLRLRSRLGDLGDAAIEDLERECMRLLQEQSWECRHGGFSLAKAIVEMRSGSDTFRQGVLRHAISHVRDKEVRLRTVVAEVAYQLARLDGVAVYLEMKEALLSSIEDSFARADTAPDASGQLPGDKKTPLMHDTEGFKVLETSFKTLVELMRGTGAPLMEHIDEALLELYFRALEHTNRFVREAGYLGLGVLCETGGQLLDRFADALAGTIASGLEDNWSQVRYASSVATRHFLLSRPNGSAYYSQFLPPMCLNRFYVAEGVRVYSQETWRMVMGTEGRAALESVMPSVAAFYAKQTEADNHAVREAACKAIAEAASKLDRAAVAPHVDELLNALMVCFRDQSWPVRDCACTACGDFVVAFPEESKVHLPALFDLWFAHLSDNIWSVRENSAVALGNAVRAYGAIALDKALDTIRERLPKAKEQPADRPSEAFPSLSNTTQFGVASAKQARDNDPHLHTEQQLYSCGSLAPKLKRATGCMDHGFSRAQEPWEATDGCVFLLRELAVLHPEVAEEFMQELAEIADLPWFGHYHNLLETVWKCVPSIATAMGAHLFATFAPLFIIPLFKTIACSNHLAATSAKWALVDLHVLMGESLETLLNEEQRAVLRVASDTR